VLKAIFPDDQVHVSIFGAFGTISVDNIKLFKGDRLHHDDTDILLLRRTP
jgi:hypothetical protein